MMEQSTATILLQTILMAKSMPFKYLVICINIQSMFYSYIYDRITLEQNFMSYYQTSENQ